MSKDTNPTRTAHKSSMPTRGTRTSEQKGKNFGNALAIHTPLPFAIAFSFGQGSAKKLYSISTTRAYKNFYNIFFHLPPSFTIWAILLTPPFFFLFLDIN